MPKINLDGTEYDTENLSDNAKAQVASLQFLEVHVKSIQNEILICKAARHAYVAALKAELAKLSVDA